MVRLHLRLAHERKGGLPFLCSRARPAAAHVSRRLRQQTSRSSYCAGYLNNNLGSSRSCSLCSCPRTRPVRAQQTRRWRQWQRQERINLTPVATTMRRARPPLV